MTKSSKIDKNNNNRPKAVETKLQAQCFELYYALGDGNRHITKLADIAVKTNKWKTNYQQLNRWKFKYFWEDRIKARDFDFIKEIRNQSTNDVSEIKKQFAEAIKNTIKQSYINDSDGRRFNFKIKNIGELNTAINSYLLLNGEATDIKTVRVEVLGLVIHEIVDTINLRIKDPALRSLIAVDLREKLQLTEGEVT